MIHAPTKHITNKNNIMVCTTVTHVFPKLQNHEFYPQGSIVSAIGHGINSVLSAIFNVVLSIVSAITNVSHQWMAKNHADNFPRSLYRSSMWLLAAAAVHAVHVVQVCALDGGQDGDADIKGIHTTFNLSTILRDTYIWYFKRLVILIPPISIEAVTRIATLSMVQGHLIFCADANLLVIFFWINVALENPFVCLIDWYKQSIRLSWHAMQIPSDHHSYLTATTTPCISLDPSPIHYRVEEETNL